MRIHTSVCMCRYPYIFVLGPFGVHPYKHIGCSNWPWQAPRGKAREWPPAPEAEDESFSFRLTICRPSTLLLAEPGTSTGRGYRSIGVLFGGFGGEVDGPGLFCLLLIIYQGHLFPLKGHLCTKGCAKKREELPTGRFLFMAVLIGVPAGLEEEFYNCKCAGCCVLVCLGLFRLRGPTTPYGVVGIATEATGFPFCKTKGLAWILK